MRVAGGSHTKHTHPVAATLAKSAQPFSRPMASAEESVDVLLLLDLDFDGDNEHELPGIFDGGLSPDLFGILEAAEFELAAAGLGKFEK